MTPTEIAVSARRVLGDINKNHWDDVRILEAINEAIQDVCKHTHAFRKEFVIELSDGVTRYALPNDFMQINRLVYEEKSIDLLSRTQIDSKRHPIVPFIGIKDMLDLQVIEIYPPLNNLDDAVTSEDGEYPEPFTVETLYGVVVEPVEELIGTLSEIEIIRDPSEYGEIYGFDDPSTEGVVIVTESDLEGVVDSIDFDLYLGTDLYGVIQSTSDFEVIGTYGLLASLVVTNRSLRIFYAAIPPELVSMNDPILLHPLWKRSLIDYTVGVLLLDDNDAADKQRAERMFVKYDRELQKARKMTKKDYVGMNERTNLSTYRSI